MTEFESKMAKVIWVTLRKPQKWTLPDKEGHWQ